MYSRRQTVRGTNECGVMTGNSQCFCRCERVIIGYEVMSADDQRARKSETKIPQDQPGPGLLSDYKTKSEVKMRRMNDKPVSQRH